MPSIRNKSAKETTVIKEQISPNNILDELYTLCVATCLTEPKARIVLSQILAHGINGFEIRLVFDDGVKYQIVATDKMTKAKAKELYNKIKNYAELSFSLI